MQTLYKPIPFSPQTRLTQSISDSEVVIQVDDINAFPDAPNLATIGIDENAETILYTAKTDTALSGCTRGIEGTAKRWQSGEAIARNFTAKDHEDIIKALSAINGSVSGFSAHAENRENPHGVTAEQVGARPDSWTPTAEQVGAVPTTRTINTKPLSGDVSLTADDVGARPATWMPTASDVGAIPTVNGTQGQLLGFTGANTIGAVAIPKSAKSLIVGTSKWGHTLSDCDYLCDGTDDQVEINQAIQDAKELKEVHILEGWYNISAPIRLPSNLKLRGASKRTTWLTRKWNSSKKEGVIACNGEECEISHLCVDGQNDTFTNADNIGIQINHGFISNVKCFDNGIGIFCNSSTITQSDASHNTIGISASGNDNIIIGNTLNSNTKGILNTGMNSLIANNYIRNSFETYDCGIEATKNALIIGNYVENSKVGIRVKDDADTTSVSGNMIRACTDGGILLAAVSNCLVDGNCIYGITGANNTTYTIVLESTDNSLVSNNLSPGRAPEDRNNHNTLVNNKY